MSGKHVFATVEVAWRSTSAFAIEDTGIWSRDFLISGSSRRQSGFVVDVLLCD
jgi:hypothetical protein